MSNEGNVLHLEISRRDYLRRYISTHAHCREVLFPVHFVAILLRCLLTSGSWATSRDNGCCNYRHDTFRIEGQWLLDYVSRFARWQHPALGHGAWFIVPVSICFVYIDDVLTNLNGSKHGFRWQLMCNISNFIRQQYGSSYWTTNKQTNNINLLIFYRCTLKMRENKTRQVTKLTGE